MILLLVISGLVGVFAYFFARVTPELTVSEPAAAASFVSDPKSLPTNRTDGLPQR